MIINILNTPYIKYWVDCFRTGGFTIQVNIVHVNCYKSNPLKDN